MGPWWDIGRCVPFVHFIPRPILTTVARDAINHLPEKIKISSSPLYWSSVNFHNPRLAQRWINFALDKWKLSSPFRLTISCILVGNIVCSPTSKFYWCRNNVVMLCEKRNYRRKKDEQNEPNWCERQRTKRGTSGRNNLKFKWNETISMEQNHRHAAKRLRALVRSIDVVNVIGIFGRWDRITIELIDWTEMKKFVACCGAASEIV